MHVCGLIEGLEIGIQVFKNNVLLISNMLGNKAAYVQMSAWQPQLRLSRNAVLSADVSTGISTKDHLLHPGGSLEVHLESKGLRSKTDMDYWDITKSGEEQALLQDHGLLSSVTRSRVSESRW